MDGGLDSEDRSLPLVRSLFATLEAGTVRYCHWKSTTGLALAMAGETDLDLLVHRADALNFEAICATLGFKRFISHPKRRLPGVQDHLGLDVTSGRLVHLHVYYQLILGEDDVKNHWLPLEEGFLGDTELRHGVRVPRAQIELAVLTARALLKYGTLAYLKDLLRLGAHGGLAPGIRRELDDLLQRTSLDEVRVAIATSLQPLPSTVIVSFLKAFERNARSAGEFRRLRRDLERHLRAYERHTAWRAAQLRLSAATARSRPIRLLGKAVTALRGGRGSLRKSPATGGRTIAIVGADGAGKTTAIVTLQQWLAWRVNVVTLYLGSARPSFLTAAAQAAAGVTGRLDRHARAPGAPTRGLAKVSGAASAATAALMALCEASDRAGRARLGRRLAGQGWVVLCDRYPMPEIVVGARRMDASRIVAPAGSGVAAAIRAFARAERRIYRRIPPPDQLIILRVEAPVALTRKPSTTAAALEAKVHAISDLAASAAGSATVVDAGRPLDEVIRDVKDIVWGGL